ncbi:hypothetical protein M432DRAFT_633325 [Thermoascus aurantiacus ATCC 26904]
MPMDRRKRVSRACDRCRSKKDKCDGARPACAACVASGLACSYDPQAKKRGLPGGYPPTADRARDDSCRYRVVGASSPAPRAEPSGGLSAPAADLLQLPPQAAQLLDRYFARTHPWFPVVARHAVLRASSRYPCRPPPDGDHAALWAILSYTADHPSTADECDAVARRLVPPETGRFEAGHVQALLLLALVRVGHADWTAAWLLCGRAVRVAQVLQAGPGEHGAALLACFVVDSLLSVRLSRRPSLRPEDVALLAEDGPDERSAWADVLGAVQGRTPPRPGPLRARSAFNRLAELAAVLPRVYNNNNNDDEDDDLRLLRALRRWDDRLPLGCRLIGPESIFPERHSALLPHQTYLCVAYVAALFALYARLVARPQTPPGLRRSALAGAKKLLFRLLPVLSQHADNFRCGLPPLFEFPLRAVVAGAFRLRARLEADAFPFRRWVESLSERIADLDGRWPVFASLAAAIEHGLRSGLPDPRPSRTTPVSGAAARVVGDTADPTRRAHDGPRDGPGDDGSDHASTIPGISIPVDGSYMTPQDSTEAPAAADAERPENTDDGAGSGGSAPPPTDLDALFKDLASSREEALRDSGSVDAVHAFRDDPDRLAGSEPPVRPPSVADIWPPPGFFPEMFHESR